MDKYCPECGLKLILKQINSFNAMYVCGNSKCKYPSEAQLVTIKRHYTEIGVCKNTDAIDKLVDEVFDTCYSSQTSSNANSDLNSVKEAPVSGSANQIGTCGLSLPVLMDETSPPTAVDSKMTGNSNKWNGFKFTSHVVKPGRDYK